MRRTSSLSLSIAALVAVSLAIPTSAHAASTLEPGIVVAPAAHELPAPNVSVADNGRALVVWTGDNPEADVRCTSGGDNCFIMGRLMNADGTFDGDAFAISADVPIDYYYAPASAAWNSTANEWLVTFTDYQQSPQVVYAQRVSAAGALVGSLRTVPSQAVTPADDRTLDAVVSDNLTSVVNATASWSAAHNAYLVTWWAQSNVDGPFFDAFGIRQATFGIFLNADLSSTDGLEAAFVLSDDGVGATTGHGYTAETAYNPNTHTWFTTWAANGTGERTGAHITLSPSISVGTPFTITSINTWSQRISAGSTVWVPALNAYVVTWSGRESGLDPFAIWGRTVTGSTLGPVTQLSAFTDEVFNDVSYSASAVRRSSVAVQGSTLQIAAHAEYPVLGGTIFRALTWSVSLPALTPSAAVVAVVGTTTASSARPNVSSGGGVTRVVWQDWPNGIYDSPAEVRVTGIVAAEESAPELADTGAAETAAVTTLAALLLSLGAALLVLRRRSLAKLKA